VHFRIFVTYPSPRMHVESRNVCTFRGAPQALRSADARLYHRRVCIEAKAKQAHNVSHDVGFNTLGLGEQRTKSGVGFQFQKSKNLIDPLLL